VRSLKSTALKLVLGIATAATAAFAAEPVALTANLMVRHQAAACEMPSAGSELLSLINEERALQSLAPVRTEPRLEQAARAHAEEMLRHRNLSHQFPGEEALAERLVRTSVRLDRSSENVTMHLSTAGAHKAFMGSAPHRANILSPEFDAIGIAVLCDADWLYVVEDFAHLIPELPDTEVADRISNQLTSLMELSGAKLLRVSDKRVEELVDSMASRGTVANSGGTALPGVLCLAGYTTTTPDQLPAGMHHLRNVSGAAQYAVGVRFARTPKYPNGTYWVAVVLYSNGGSFASLR
jgi:uncharacterized protein YkwD